MKFSTIVFLTCLLFTSTISLKMKSRSKIYEIEDLAINTDINLNKNLSTHVDRCDKDFDILRRVKNTIQVRNNTDTPYLNHQIESLKDLLFSEDGKRNWVNFVKTVFDEIDTDFNGKISKSEMSACFDVLTKYVHIPQSKLRDDLVDFKFNPEKQPAEPRKNNTQIHEENSNVELDFERFLELITDICMLQLQQYRLEKIESLILSIFSDSVDERTDYSVDLMTIHRLKTVLNLRNEENWEDFDAIAEYLFKITDVNNDGVIDHQELKEAYTFLSDYLNFPRELVTDENVNQRMEMFAAFNNNNQTYVNSTNNEVPVMSYNEKNNNNGVKKVINMNVLNKNGFVAVIFEVLEFVVKNLEEKVCSEDVFYSTMSSEDYSYSKNKKSKKLNSKIRNLSLSTLKLKVYNEKGRSLNNVLNLKEEKPTLLELTISLNLLLNPHNPEKNILNEIGSNRYHKCLREINTRPNHSVTALTEKDFEECFRGLDNVRKLYQYYSSEEYLRSMFEWYSHDGLLDEDSFNEILRSTLDGALHEVFNAQCNEWRLGSVDVFSYSKLKSKNTKSFKSKCKTC